MNPSTESAFAAALEPWLATRIPGFAGPLDVRKFAGGQSNPTYLLTTPGRKYVMRAKPGPAAKLLPSAHAVDREFRVMTALAGTGVPVPRTHVLCEDESVIGRAFFVMEHVDGRVLWKPSLPDQDPAGRAAIFDEMNRVIAALHAVKPADVGLGDYGKPGDFLERQIGRWIKQYRLAATETIDEMDRLIEWLPAHKPPVEEIVLYHGDYKLDNVIFANDRPEILAIIDWELSTLGDPMADFAYHCLMYHNDEMGLRGADLAALGVPGERAYLEQYCARTGRDIGRALPHWDFYIAFNLFRLASIVQGIVKRANDGTASNPDAPRDTTRVRKLATRGWAVANGNR